MDEKRREWPLQVSCLVDGELSVDQANTVLAAMLDDNELQQVLREQLRLNGTLGVWRELAADPSAIDEPADHEASSPRRLPAEFDRAPVQHSRTPTALFSGVLVGGLLVLTGFFAAQFFRTGLEPATETAATAGDAELATPLFIVPEKQREVEAVFAMHEQLAGPLAWMADSAEQIQLAEATRAQPPQTPVAILLELQEASELDGGAHQYVVVCRGGAPVTIDVPFGGHSMRVHLLPDFDSEQGRIQLQYAMSIPAPNAENTALAVLTGEQDLDLHAAPLGQLIVENRLLSLSAGAWTF